MQQLHLPLLANVGPGLQFGVHPEIPHCVEVGTGLEHRVQARLGLLQRVAAPQLHCPLLADVGPGLKLRVDSHHPVRVEVGAGLEHQVQARLGLLRVLPWLMLPSGPEQRLE